jgi:hypothetical protein
MKPVEERKALRDMRGARATLEALEVDVVEALARDDEPAERFGQPGGLLGDPVHKAVERLCEDLAKCAEHARAASLKARVLTMYRRRAE